jgi:hypothetical protein
MDKKKIDIPKDPALQHCGEIRQQYQGKWWTYGGMHCMDSTAARKGDLTKLWVSNGYRIETKKQYPVRRKK